MKSSLLLLYSLIIVLGACQEMASSQDASKEEWMPLFNGVDLNGWDIKFANQELNHNFKNTFIVQDSMIRIRYDEYENFEDAYAHMYYDKPFSYYKLRFDYRFIDDQIAGGATWNERNSGIMLHSQSAMSNEYGQGFPVSVELQLLGGLSDGNPRTTANVCTPGTAVEMGDTINYTHCINSTSRTYHGDQWVHSEAIVRGGESMEFIVEGDTVLAFQSPQIGGGYISASYEGKDWDQFNISRDKADWIAKDGSLLTEGYIALQAESHPIDFKNIELLNLCGCMDPKAINYKSYYIKDDPTNCQY